MIKVGDIIYPAEDGKKCRVTKCIVSKIEDNKIEVKGIFWGKEEEKIQTLKFIKDKKCLGGIGYWEDEYFYYVILREEQVPEYLRKDSYYNE